MDTPLYSRENAPSGTTAPISLSHDGTVTTSAGTVVFRARGTTAAATTIVLRHAALASAKMCAKISLAGQVRLESDSSCP